jgi:hypothetical protein
MTVFPLYTIGYTKLDPALLKTVAEAQNWLIADIRIRPQSRDPRWNKGRLVQLFGDRYLHVVAFGNLNYKGDMGPDVMLADAKAGGEILIPIMRERSVVLMCMCWDYAVCHRLNAAQFLRNATGCTITHLSLKDLAAFTASEPAEPPPPTPKQTSFL